MRSLFADLTQPADDGWIVDFWLDPACPLTRHTARWIGVLAEALPLGVRWRVMSLSVLNEHRDDDPEDDPDGYLWIPARVAVAVQTEHGHAALGAFYDALWTHRDGTEREWLGDLRDALERSRLPTELADAGMSTEYDQALRASHRQGVERIDAEVGTPLLSVTSPDGHHGTFFGPVLRTVPETAEAHTLWRALQLLVTTSTFRELQA